jgi:hypothetical protein
VITAVTHDGEGARSARDGALPSQFRFFRASRATRITVDHTALVKAKGTKAAKSGMTKKAARRRKRRASRMLGPRIIDYDGRRRDHKRSAVTLLDSAHFAISRMPSTGVAASTTLTNSTRRYGRAEVG